MTTTAPPIRPAGRVADAVRGRRRIEQICYLTGAALILVGVAHLGVALALPRPWDGPLSWRKPVTFGTSFGTVLITITWVSSYLRLAARTRTVLLGVFAADCVVEVAGITAQAWRHQPSHFNNVGVLNSVVAYSLAAGGVVLVATLGTFAVVALRGRIDAPPPMTRALRAGFALLLAGLAAGAAMIARGEALIGAGERTLAYQTAGFLKWFHAIALHAVLVLPALAWFLARTRLDEARQLRGVTIGVVAYLIAAAVALVANLVLV
jgi:hypothetical protein